MDEEKEYWLEQIKIYNSIKCNPHNKYYEWQPARWAGNNSAVTLISKYINDIRSACEIGAGSCAFSISIYNYNNNIIITAVDKSSKAVKYGKQIAKDLRIPIIYHKKDLFDFIGKYDLVLSLGVIEHYNYEKMVKFVEKCISLSNKYIFIAIPNQESIFFKNYVSWSEKNSKKYGEEHKKFSTDDLEKIMKEKNLEIICVDGFQMFLSEKNFLSEETKENFEIINLLKEKLYKYDKGLAEKFPDINFHKKDINSMTLAELDFNKDIRKKYSFMTFVLAKVK